MAEAPERSVGHTYTVYPLLIPADTALWLRVRGSLSFPARIHPPTLT
jgi:hypothetical protein